MQITKNKLKILGIALISILLACLFLAFVKGDEIRASTGNEIVPILRGESRGVLMDPDKMYTLYYVTDGRPATIQYSESWGSYLFGKSDFFVHYQQM